MDPVRVLVLGAGNMAGSHAKAFVENPQAELVAAVDVNEAGLADFGERFGVSRLFTDLDEAIAWGGFDAASNVTPDNIHHATTMKLAAAGKHILCEKPLAPSHEEAWEMTRAVESAGLVNLVNLRYRALPECAEAARLVAKGAIGTVRHVSADYLQSWLVGNQWGDWKTEPRWLWRLSTGHGSTGALGDVGVHIIDAALFVSGLFATGLGCRLRTFHKAPGDRIGEYELDANDSFIITMDLEGGGVAMIQSSRSATGYANAIHIEVFGDRGGLRVAFEKEEASLHICAGGDVNDQTWRPVTCPPASIIYDRFIDAIANGSEHQPDFRRAARVQNLLDLAVESDREGRVLSVE